MADRPMMEWTIALFRRPGLRDLSFLPYVTAALTDRAFEDLSRCGVITARAAAAQDDGASGAVDRIEAFLNDPSPIIDARGAPARRIPVAGTGAGA